MKKQERKKAKVIKNGVTLILPRNMLIDFIEDGWVEQQFAEPNIQPSLKRSK